MPGFIPLSPPFYNIFTDTQEPNIDDSVKSLKNPFCVIPVETGIQYYQVVMSSLDTRCSLSRFIGAGMTTFYDVININYYMLYAEKMV